MEEYKGMGFDMKIIIAQYHQFSWVTSQHINPRPTSTPKPTEVNTPEYL